MTARTLNFRDKIVSMSIAVPESGCWIWEGASVRGYGQVSRHGKMTYAHRVAYEAFIGPIPAGYDVLHKCDTPSCVNPAHLFIGTHADNMADMHRKGRARHLAEELHPQARLDARAVSDIRDRHARGESFARMAREYGVHECTVARAAKGNTWRRGGAKVV